MNAQMPQPGGPSAPASTAKPVLRASAAWVLTGFVSFLLIGSLIAPGWGVVIGAVLASVTSSLVGVKTVRDQNVPIAQGATPLAHTPEGEPIYQVVGYTAEGTPITADRAVGLRPVTSRTNTLAIATLIVSLVLAPLAIPLGHISMAQMERTGEQGRGLAIAGLVIGYIGLVALFIFALVITLSQT
jgi:hypothetical protein